MKISNDKEEICNLIEKKNDGRDNFFYSNKNKFSKKRKSISI